MNLFNATDAGSPSSRRWPADWPSVNRAGCKAGDLLAWFSSPDLYRVVEVHKDERPHRVVATIQPLLAAAPVCGRPPAGPAIEALVRRSLDERYMVVQGDPPSHGATLPDTAAPWVADAIREAMAKEGATSVRIEAPYSHLVRAQAELLEASGYDVITEREALVVYLPA